MNRSLLKIQFGSGGNPLDGWVNHDSEVDIRGRLPYDDNVVDCILAEHVVEHISSADALRFFDECRRILRPNGVLRVCVPSVEKVFFGQSTGYFNLAHERGLGDASPLGAGRAVLLGYGHQSAWTWELLQIVMSLAGFRRVYRCMPRMSDWAELRGVDSHHRAVGEELNDFETAICEGIK